MSGIGAIVLWPACVVAGLVVGSVVAGPSLAGIVAGAVLAAAGIIIGPAYGWQVGTVSSWIDRLAMRSDHASVLAIGRRIATLVWLGLFFGAPLAIGLGAAIAPRWLGLT